MKKLLVLALIVSLLAAAALFAGEKKQSEKDSKAQITAKIEKMKQAGASEEEINVVIADYKKKVAAKEAQAKETAKLKAEGPLVAFRNSIVRISSIFLVTIRSEAVSSR